MSDKSIKLSKMNQKRSFPPKNSSRVSQSNDESRGNSQQQKGNPKQSIPSNRKSSDQSCSKKYTSLPLNRKMSSRLSSSSSVSDTSMKSVSKRKSPSLQGDHVSLRLSDEFKFCMMMPSLINNVGLEIERPVLLIIRTDNVKEIGLQMPYKLKLSQTKLFFWRQVDNSILHGQIVAIADNLGDLRRAYENYRSLAMQDDEGVVKISRRTDTLSKIWPETPSLMKKVIRSASERDEEKLFPTRFMIESLGDIESVPSRFTTIETCRPSSSSYSQAIDESSPPLPKSRRVSPVSEKVSESISTQIEGPLTQQPSSERRSLSRSPGREQATSSLLANRGRRTSPTSTEEDSEMRTRRENVRDPSRSSNLTETQKRPSNSTGRNNPPAASSMVQRDDDNNDDDSIMELSSNADDEGIESPSSLRSIPLDILDYEDDLIEQYQNGNLETNINGDGMNFENMDEEPEHMESFPPDRSFENSSISGSSLSGASTDFLSSLKYSKKRAAELEVNTEVTKKWEPAKQWIDRTFEERFNYFKNAYELVLLNRSHLSSLDPYYRLFTSLSDAVFGSFLMQDNIRTMNRASNNFFIDRENDSTRLDKDGKTLLLEGIMPLNINAVEKALKRSNHRDPLSILSHLVRIAFPTHYYSDVQLGVSRRKSQNIRTGKTCLATVLGYPDPLNRPNIGDCNPREGEKRIKALIEFSMRAGDKFSYDSSFMGEMRAKLSKALWDMDKKKDSPKETEYPIKDQISYLKERFPQAIGGDESDIERVNSPTMDD